MTLVSEHYVIGRYYPIPTVRGRVYDYLHDWPVMGPEHEDAEFINFPHQHYHIDWRFVPGRLFNALDGGWISVVALPLMGKSSGGLGPNPDGLPNPVMRRLKCKRELPAYPGEKATWLPRLEEKYQDCRLKTPICPHRGIALDNLPCNEDGVVTCPGHGLRWNIKTGELVRTQK